MLRFQIQKTEWIRPLFNHDFYRYAKKAFLYLLVWTLVLFMGTMFFADDLSALLYMSLLLPFNCLSMYISLRRADERTGTKVIITFALVLMATIIFQLISGTAHRRLSDGIMVLLYEVISIIIVTRFSSRYSLERSKKETEEFSRPQISTRDLMKTMKPDERKTAFKESIREYKYAVILSIILIAAMPAIGIVSFTVQSEKYQIKKNMALTAARDFEKRIDWVMNKRPEYKKVIQHSFLFHNHFREDGVFLGQTDLIRLDTAATEPKPKPICDKPYCFLLDRNISYLNPGSLQSLSIPDKAKDGSWYFDKTDSATMTLHYDMPFVDSLTNANAIVIETPIHKTFADFFNQPFMQWFLWILTTVLIIYFSASLLTACLDRLFFFDYMIRYDTTPDADALKIFFSESQPAPGTIMESKPNVPGNKAAASAPETPNAKPENKAEGLGDQSKENKRDMNTPAKIILSEDPLAFFRYEEWVSPAENENIIFNNTQTYTSQYDAIWKSLSQEEQYVLYDFALDKYTNYKLSHVLMSLIRKGILTVQDSRISLDFFSLSFRNFVLTKKDSQEILDYQKKWSAPGTWESMKIPILSIVGAAAIFLILTQGEFTQKVSGILTSIAALLPLIFKLFDRKTT